MSSLCRSSLSFYARYTALLLGTLAAYSLGMLVNFKSILQFTMSVVRTSSFVSDHGMHAHSPSCDGIPGALYIDSYYAGLTSFIAWVMLLPAVYEVAKVITPGNPLTRQEYKDSMAARAAAAAAGDEVPVAVAISDHGTENPLSKSHSLSSKMSFSASDKSFRDTLVQSLAKGRDVTWWLLRLPLTSVAPDLWIAQLARGWGECLKGLVAPRAAAVHAAPSVAASVGVVSDVDVAAAAPGDAPILPSGPTAVLASTLHSLSAFAAPFLSTLHPSPAAETALWLEREHFLLLPSYFNLLKAEVKDTFPDHDPPFIFILLYACTFLGHVLTRRGRRVWWLIGTKYWDFLLVSLGVWNDRSFALFGIREQVASMCTGREGKEEDEEEEEKGKEKDKKKKNEEGRDINETNRAYSQCLSAVISTRVVLLQVVPQLALLSIYAIATSSAPLFVAPGCKLYGKLFPPIITNPFERARLAEPLAKFRNTKWIIWLSGINILVTQSRLMQHLVQLLTFVLSISVLYAPSSKASILFFACVFLPYCLAQSLVLIVGLWKAMDLSDEGEGRLAGAIVELAQKGLGESEICRLLYDFALSSSGGMRHGRGKQTDASSSSSGSSIGSDGNSGGGDSPNRSGKNGRGAWRSEEEEASALEEMVRSYQHASFVRANPLLTGRQMSIEMGPMGGLRDSIPSAADALPPGLHRPSAREDPELTGRDSGAGAGAGGAAGAPGVARISLTQMAGAMQGGAGGAGGAGGGGLRGSGAGLGPGAVVPALSLARHAQQHAAQVHGGHQHLQHRQDQQQQQQQQQRLSTSQQQQGQPPPEEQEQGQEQQKEEREETHRQEPPPQEAEEEEEQLQEVKL